MRDLLTRGNTKLGDGTAIWSWSLPSATDLCVGATDVCKRHCYSKRVEARRPSVLACYRRNLELSRTPGFAGAVVDFIRRRGVRVVRVHVGGDVYSVEYAAKWLAVFRECRDARFFLYTRSWRDPGIANTLEEMSRLPNTRVWFSCDRETGLPGYVPERVRLAWMMTAASDTPPRSLGRTADLVFRTQALRKIPLTRIEGIRVCPPEAGMPYSSKVTCATCRICWKPT